MNGSMYRYILELLAKDNIDKFYATRQWRQLRTEVLEEQHNECYICKQDGKIVKADCVHHHIHVKDNPRLALSKTYTDEEGNEQVQLMCLCNSCHNKVHDEKLKYRNKSKKMFTNEERW